MTVEEALALAVDRHQAGDLAGAAVIYRRILDADPRHGDALNLMGVALLQIGRPAEGEELIARAVRHHPRFAEARNNLGNARRDQGRLGPAEACYRTALALSPDYARCARNLADTLQASGRPTEAAVWQRRALAFDPRAADVRTNLGNALHDVGRHDEAIAWYRSALALNPALGEAWGNLGVALLAVMTAAKEPLKRSRRLQPGLFAPTLAAAEAERRSGGDSRGAWRHCLALAPAESRAVFGLVRALFEAGREEEAALWLRRRSRIDGRVAGEARSARLASVADWCAATGSPYRTILPERRTAVTISGAFAGPVAYRLPETWLARVDEALVIPVNHAVIVGGSTLLLDGLHAYSRVSLTEMTTYPHEAADGRVLIDLPPPGERIDDEAVLFGGDGNFAHGVLDWGSRLVALDGRSETAGLPVLTSAYLRPAVVDFLETLGLVRDRLRPIRGDRATSCRRLWLPSLTHAFQYPAPEYLSLIRRRFATTADPRRRIFVPRRGAAHRALLNEAEVLAALAPFGIETLVPDELSLAEQVERLAEAELVVTTIGGGSAAIVFAPVGAAVVELTHSRCVVPQYGILAAQLGQRYDQVVGEPVTNRGRINFDWDFHVDPAVAARAVAALIGA